MIWALLLLCIAAIAASSYAIWLCRGELAAQERINEVMLEKINRLTTNDKTIHVILVQHKHHIDQIYELLQFDGGVYVEYDESYTRMEQ